MARWRSVVPSSYSNIADRGGVSGSRSDSTAAISSGERRLPPSFFSSLLLLFSGLAWLVKPPVVAGWIGEGLGH